MSQRSSLIVIHFYSYYSFSCVASSFFPWLCYCAYRGCISWLIPDSFLTHIILHAGRIFQQWCHNCIICLVVESALHVYKGQFSTWFGQFTYYGISYSMEFHHQYPTDSISAWSQVQSKHLTSRLGVSQTLEILVSILHHHCLHHKLPGSINSWPNTNQVYSLHIWYMPTNQLGCGIEESVLDICITGTVRYRSQSAGLVIQVKR